MFTIGESGPTFNNAFLTLRSICAPTIAVLEYKLIRNIFNNVGRLSHATVNATRFAVLNTDNEPVRKDHQHS